jgi:hypothetical protein
MSANDPNPPITELAAAAVQLHELFRAYVDAGFTEPQAMQLCVALLQGRKPE